MEINTNLQLKMPKKKFEGRRAIINQNSLDIRLWGCSEFVGFMIVQKELKYDLKGYIGRCTHEELKSGALETLKF